MVTYASSVSAELPKKMQFDKNKKKLPTPYWLFCEWAKNNLRGDWASTTIAGGGAVAVESQSDIALIQSTFGASTQSKKHRLEIRPSSVDTATQSMPVLRSHWVTCCRCLTRPLNSLPTVAGHSRARSVYGRVRLTKFYPQL